MLRILAFGLVLVASVCTAGNTKTLRTATGSPVVRLEPGRGMVMMRLIQSDQVSSFLATWERFQFHEAATGVKYEIVDPYGAGHNTFFVASIPPGEYVADRVSKEKSDPGAPINYISWGNAGFPPEGGWRFRVERGRLTNLGTLIFLRAYNQTGKKWFRWVHVPDETLPQRNAFFFEEDAQPALLSPAIGWTEVPAQSSEATLTTATRHLSMYLAGMAPANGGGRLFGEFFGQVAWRHPDGSWTWEDTGTIETILAAIDGADGTRWAVAEGSLLLERGADGRWNRVPVPLEDARPCLVYAEADGSLLTAWTQLTAITVLRYRPGSETPWSTERVLDAPRGVFSLPGTFARCRASMTQDRVMVIESTAPFGAPKYRLDVLDLATRHWSTAKVSVNSPLVVAPDGTLVVLGGLAINPKYRFSKDLGRTWMDRANPAALGMPMFKSATEAFVLRLDAPTGNRPASNSYWRTIDGSRTWEQISTFANPTFDLVLLLDGTSLFVTRYGLLYSSSDDGRTIRLERDSSATTW